MITAEVIIVGGGPAGSTCAWKLIQGGVEAIVIDRKEFPRTKLCAGWITPKVIKDLQLNLNEYPHSLLKFNRLYFHISGRRIPVITRQYSIRRYEFDHYLLQRSGAEFHHHTVREIRRENGYYFIDEQFRCKYLMGAGGTNCPVYRTFFKELNPRNEKARITTMEEEFPFQTEDKNCYLWFTENNLPGYSWYVPKGNGYLNVGIGGKFTTIKSHGETIRDHWNLLVEKLTGRALVKDYSFQPRGYNYYLRQDVRIPRKDNAFILGDAAGLATRDMGEGIGPAIESGINAATAILTGGEYSLKSVTRYSIFTLLFPWRHF